MAIRATGTFDVKLAPQPDGANVGDPSLGRMSIDKQFHGDLDGTSKGQMLAHSTAVPDSAGYVALERVTATLGGRHGSFVLQHSSTMQRGEPTQSITVIPDSGTDGLTGLTGSMVIDIKDDQHYYTFDYTLL